jgi:Flp pilus assembly protein TadD
VQDEYFHDRRASAAAWQTVIDRARAGRVYNPSRTEARAHIGYARLLERAGDRARAIESYRNALRVAGSDPRPRDDARAALKRLGAS